MISFMNQSVIPRNGKKQKFINLPELQNLGVGNYKDVKTPGLYSNITCFDVNLNEILVLVEDMYSDNEDFAERNKNPSEGPETENK